MTTITQRVHTVLNDPNDERSMGSQFRARRWQKLQQEFPDIESMRVLDLGGRVDYWLRAPVRPASVVVLNYEEQSADESWITTIQGDACSPPSSLRHPCFDLVHSNSLLEHVGGHYRRQALAEVIHELAPRHWIQTPYRYFPIEPHWLFPGFQFLSVTLRVRAATVWPFAWSRPAGRKAVQKVLNVELLSITEMKFYFPSSDIAIERAAGLPKSLVAVKR